MKPHGGHDVVQLAPNVDWGGSPCPVWGCCCCCLAAGCVVVRAILLVRFWCSWMFELVSCLDDFDTLSLKVHTHTYTRTRIHTHTHARTQARTQADETPVATWQGVLFCPWQTMQFFAAYFCAGCQTSCLLPLAFVVGFWCANCFSVFTATLVDKLSESKQFSFVCACSYANRWQHNDTYTRTLAHTRTHSHTQTHRHTHARVYSKSQSCYLFIFYTLLAPILFFVVLIFFSVDCAPLSTYKHSHSRNIKKIVFLLVFV